VDERVGDFSHQPQPGQYAVVVITNVALKYLYGTWNPASYAIFTLDSTQIDTTIELGTILP
jgi:putative heme degradation protein